MTGLFDGDTPELSEYEVAFDKALELLRAEKASLDSKIQSLDDDIEKYRAMFSFIFPEDQSEDGK
jgi:predicted nuclease with TOPRIM domain